MPYCRFEIVSPLSPAAAAEKIQALTRPPSGVLQNLKTSLWLADPPLVPFVGRVDAGSFEIRRDIRYRNSFLPLVMGEIKATPTGSKMEICMRVHGLVLVFMLLWFSMSGLFALIHLIKSDYLGLLGVAAMAGFGVALVAVGFFPEVRQARKRLEDALQSAEAATASRRL